MNLRKYEQEEIKAIFKAKYPLLVFHSYTPSIFPNTCYITTKAIIYGAFSLDLRNLALDKLDLIPAHNEKKVQ